jgi:hypothetical protein
MGAEEGQEPTTALSPLSEASNILWGGKAMGLSSVARFRQTRRSDQTEQPPSPQCHTGLRTAVGHESAAGVYRLLHAEAGQDHE